MNLWKESDFMRPTAQQVAWQDLEVGMFLSLAPNTWQDLEYDDLSTPLSAINPKDLDAAQWVDAAEAMGARYIVFVAKHVGGFCMWPTETTNHSIAHTPWRGGKGHVCRDLADQCQRRGMKLGFYLSPQDSHFGVGLSGRARSGHPEHQALYDRIYQQQLTELCTRYGPLVELWFDGSTRASLVEPILSKHQPQAVVFQSDIASIRWSGNEDGVASYPVWSEVRAEQILWRRETYEAQRGPILDHTVPRRWLPVECDVPIRYHWWFWSSKNADSPMPLDRMTEIYYHSVGYVANLLINHTPDPTGLIPEADVRRGAEFGAEVKRRFGLPLAQTHGTGDVFEIDLKRPTRIDHVVSMEAIEHGQRVLEYEVEAMAGNAWQSTVRGDAIGHNKIERFEPVLAAKMRLRVHKALAEPHLRSVAVFQTGP